MPIEPVIEQPLRMRSSDRYGRRRRRYLFLAVGLASGMVIGLVGGLILAGPAQPPQAAAGGAVMTARYHAVTLTNGLVFVGHLDKLGSSFPVLSEIHTIQKKPQEGGKGQDSHDDGIQPVHNSQFMRTCHAFATFLSAP